MPTYNYSSKGQNKLLKGPQFVGNIASFDNIIVNNIALDNLSSILSGVIIDNSNIYNTVIGIGGPKQAYFTDLRASGVVQFDGDDVNNYVKWDPITNTFDIRGELQVTGCSYFDNIEICENTISATNTNGQINIIPNNTGRVNVIGSINNVTTTGNFNSNVMNGGFYVNASSNVTIGSQKSSTLLSAFSENNIETINGDINLTTETGRAPQIVQTISLLNNKYEVTSVYNHNLRAGDKIVIENSEPQLNGEFEVLSIVDTKTFFFTSGNTTIVNTSTGNFLKVLDNNINLNAGKSVNIPSNINLNFGLPNIDLIGDTNGNLTISAQDNIIIDGNLLSINTINTRFYDPILTISDFSLTENDNLDRGIEFRFFNTNASLEQTAGWFGYKNELNAFTFLTNITNNDEIITGDYGDIYASSFSGSNIFVSAMSVSNISSSNAQFSGILSAGTIVGMTISASNIYSNSGIYLSGDLDLQCNNLLNANIISSCNDNITITSQNILLSAAEKITIPYNTYLTFGVSTSNIYSDTSGNLNLNASNTVIIDGNLQVNGTTMNVYSTITNIQDPIISIGGVTGPVVNDARDRGIEFKWASNGTTKTGFFGYQHTSDRFIFIPDGINIYEVFYGSFGDVQFGNGYFTNLDLESGDGNITGVNNISSNLNLTINNDNLILDSANDIRILNNVPIYYDNTDNVYTQLNTNGNFYISNTYGSIILESQTINVPDTSPIVFGSTTEQIYSTNGSLSIEANNSIILDSENINISGNLNYSVERYTLSSSLQDKDPSLSTSVTFVSVDGVSFNSYGTLGNTGISDGQIKTILCSSIGENCTYTVHVGSGHLIAPNAGNNTQASKLQFNRAGQSVQMIFDNVLSSWLILGRGCVVF